MEDTEFEVTAEDCHRWAAELRQAAEAQGDTDDSRMRVLCAYLLYCFADTIADDLVGGVGVLVPDPKGMN